MSTSFSFPLFLFFVFFPSVLNEAPGNFCGSRVGGPFP